MSCFLVALFRCTGVMVCFRSIYRFSQASWNICCDLLLFREVEDPIESSLESLEI